MAVNYATNRFPREEHTEVNVPLFANRQLVTEEGENRIPALVSQPELFHIMAGHLGLE